LKKEARAAQKERPRRYLGMDLAGAKNQKTALATLEYYPREQKTFLLDVYDRIVPKDEQTGDEALLEVLEELRGGPHEVALLGVNVPLTLPPCAICSRKACSKLGKCGDPAVKWMRDFTRKNARAHRAEPGGIRVRDFTPYTQRPTELYVRYQVMPELEPAQRFEIDESLGGNKAPLTMRMQYLKRYLVGLPVVETWPKLTIALLSRELGISRRMIMSYRRLEEGIHARQEILEAMAKRFGLFIYDRDLRKLSQSLPAFDAFACAYTALLSDTGRCAKVPSGFPDPEGWVHHPKP